MEILSRLVREGQITLEEAFLLSEKEVVHIPVQTAPYQTPLPPSRTYEYPWFGINNPTTGESLGPVLYNTSSISGLNQKAWSRTNSL